MRHNPSEDAPKNEHPTWKKGSEMGKLGGIFVAKQLAVCTTSLCRRALRTNETQMGSEPSFGAEIIPDLSADEVILLSGCLSPACKLQPESGLRNSLHGREMMWSLKECVDFGEVVFILFGF